jgi:copper resistance protein D
VILAVPTSWEFASLLCKFLLYVGIACVAGGGLSLWLYSDGSRRSLQLNLRYILVGAVFGFQGVLANFFIQVGLVNDSGPGGMFDWSMASILLDTAVGDSTVWRLAGFVIVLGACPRFISYINHRSRPPELKFYLAVTSSMVLAALILAYSFSQVGHVSVLSTPARIAVVIHVFAVALWLGALYPLLRLTAVDDRQLLQLTMRRFGDHALVIVLLLLIAGAVMLWEVLSSPRELFSTAYGQLLSLKLVLVASILGIAGVNKFLLVPCLSDTEGALRLRRSIRIEMVVATLILLATTYLSTIVGPMQH